MNNLVTDLKIEKDRSDKTLIWPRHKLSGECLSFIFLPSSKMDPYPHIFSNLNPYPTFEEEKNLYHKYV